MLVCTPTSQALDLPEVLLRIGCYLDAGQILICSQVCSAWYIVFAPVVWENLHIGRPKTNASSCKYRYQRVLEPRTRSIDLVSEDCNPREQLDIITSKANWLRSLTIHQHVSPQQFTLGKECTQLQAISITGPIPFNDDYTREYWNSCKALIKQNRSRLTSLTVDRMQFISNYERSPLGVPQWNPILSCAGHTLLTELKLVVCHIRGRHLKPFWKICERLEKLTLDNVVFDYSRLPTQEQIQNNSKAARAARERAARRPNKKTPPPPPPPKRFPNLRELTVKGIPHRRPDRFLDLIIADCPRLESLDFSSQLYSSAFAEHFTSHVVGGTWPLLNSIRLSLSFFQFPQNLFLTILEHNRKPLKVISVTNRLLPHLGEKTFNVLKERHFSTLREIHLLFLNAECWIQEVLASCPSLEVVNGITLCTATMMKDKRPWVCLGLKEFRMSLEITKGSPEEESPEAILEQRQQESRALCAQLARLRKLQSLSLTTTLPRTSLTNKEPFSLRLEMGLDLLAGLTQLEVINLDKDQDMDRNDILWIAENFTSLKMISGGRLNVKKAGPKAFKDKYLWDFELAKTLNGHGIETPMSTYEDGYLDDVRHLLGKGWPEIDDLLSVEEEPAALEETVQAVAPEEAAVLEDAVQAVELEETVQAVEPEVAVQIVEPEETIQAAAHQETVQAAQLQETAQAMIQWPTPPAAVFTFKQPEQPLSSQNALLPTASSTTMDQLHSPISNVLPCTPASQALILPEVLFRIGCYLEGGHALTCSQVCSTWYLNFAPMVWANLHIGRPKPNAKDKKYNYQRELEPRTRSIDLVSEDCNSREQLDIVRSKASWLRSLTIHRHVSPLQFTLGKECTQLKAISITGTIPFDDDYTREYWNSCKALIKQNRSRLTSLTVDTMLFDIWNKPEPGEPRWDPFLSCAGHSNLTELKLIFCNVRGRHLKSLWKICERLEKLTLDNVVFDYSRLPTQEQIQNNSKAARAARKKAARRPNKNTSSPPSLPKRFPHLRELTVKELPHGSPDRFLDLIIADCPRLESLDWTLEFYTTIYIERFIHHIVAGTWPLLEKIKLDVSFFDVNELQLSILLQHTRSPLKVISINKYLLFYQDRTFDIIKERHFSTLQEIHLSFLGKDRWFQDLLASCHLLEIFSAVKLDAAVVMEDKRPWACLGLKEFRMSLDITKGTPVDPQESAQKRRQEQSRALFTQLGRLKHLRSLSLDAAQSRACEVDKEPLPLRLKMGLDLLAGQTQLEMINLCKDQDMDRNDILWIVENFTSLKMISGGRLNVKKAGPMAFTDKYLWDFELAKTLNGHGIETPLSTYEDGYLDDVRNLLGKGWPESDNILCMGDARAASNGI
ncbi:hypothetical protein BGZ67_002658 [Mortierella alpina]|nr:hypothetical protein BGZ67_002658 [Mortierella alpina]